MEQITVSEPNNLSYIQETPRLLWNSKFRHHVCKTAPLLTTLTLLHSAHNRTLEVSSPCVQDRTTAHHPQLTPRPHHCSPPTAYSKTAPLLTTISLLQDRTTAHHPDLTPFSSQPHILWFNDRL